MTRYFTHGACFLSGCHLTSPRGESDGYHAVTYHQNRFQAGRAVPYSKMARRAIDRRELTADEGWAIRCRGTPLHQLPLEDPVTGLASTSGGDQLLEEWHVFGVNVSVHILGSTAPVICR